MDALELYARCASGLEPLLAAELKELGMQRVRPLRGGVAFFGDVRDAYRACLWSRLASRVLCVVARGEARDADGLYELVRSVAWEEHVPAGATISVYAHGGNDSLRNTQFIAVKAKDAACDRLNDARGERPCVARSRADVCIDVTVRTAKATVAIDLSGESLQRRGYRSEDAHGIPETLAAALLAACGWREIARAGGGFVDPYCADGVLAIEAALAASDTAPGATRAYWGFTGWAQHDAAVWGELLEEADARAEAGHGRSPHVAGLAHGSRARKACEAAARRAGVADLVRFEEGGASALDGAASLLGRRTAGTQRGLVATSLLQEGSFATPGQTPALLAALSDGFSRMKGEWRCGVLLPDALAADADTAFGAEPLSAQPMRSGSDEACARLYALPSFTQLRIPALDGTERALSLAEPSSEQFAHRLRKVAKERAKWARRAGVSCYRLYDADLQDFALALDWYEGAGGFEGARFLRVAEYAPPASVDAARAARRMRDALVIAPAVLGVDPGCVLAKTRRRDKGGSQYRDAKGHPRPAVVTESGYLFEIDLEGYLDTGLFLDHRLTRELVGSMAKDAQFLNLFAYTGTATVHAAGGGAAGTTTVDLSNTYLDWAERNMELNGLAGPDHEFIRADVMRFITDERRSPRRYDLIFVDPPTFSNSKSMGMRTWDVQRDHVELLIGVSRLLTPEGRAVFSCNLRSFAPDTEKLERYGVRLTDITEKTIPEDFKRNPKIHKCYLVERVRAS